MLSDSEDIAEHAQKYLAAAVLADGAQNVDGAANAHLVVGASPKAWAQVGCQDVEKMSRCCQDHGSANSRKQ